MLGTANGRVWGAPADTYTTTTTLAFSGSTSWQASEAATPNLLFKLKDTGWVIRQASLSTNLGGFPLSGRKVDRHAPRTGHGGAAGKEESEGKDPAETRSQRKISPGK